VVGIASIGWEVAVADIRELKGQDCRMNGADVVRERRRDLKMADKGNALRKDKAMTEEEDWLAAARPGRS